MQNLPKWAKMVNGDSSIKKIISCYITSHIISDFIVLGYNSLRLFNVQNRKINEVTRYDHISMISDVSVIRYDDTKCDIIFISKRTAFILNFTSDFKLMVSKTIQLNRIYEYISTSEYMFCLYSMDPYIILFENNYTSKEYSFDYSIIISLSFFRENIVILYFKDSFFIDIYEVSDFQGPILSRKLPHEFPYKLYYSSQLNSLYILSESKVTIITMNSTGYIFDPHVLNLDREHSIICDATTMGSQLIVISDDGGLLTYNDKFFLKKEVFDGLVGIASLTVNKCVIVLENGRLVLLDKDFSVLDNFEGSYCRSVSYKMGNFLIASEYSVKQCFYDYGISANCFINLSHPYPPQVSVSGEFIILKYYNKMIVLSEEYKNITPSFLNRKTYERLYVNSQKFMFALNHYVITVFDHGVLYKFNYVSTLSLNKDNVLILVENNTIFVLQFYHTKFLTRTSKVLDFHISSISFYNDNNVIISSLYGDIMIVDEDLQLIKHVKLDYTPTSISEFRGSIVISTDQGELIYLDRELHITSILKIADTPISVHGVNSCLTLRSRTNSYVFVNNSLRILPSNLLMVYPYKDNSYISFVKKYDNKNGYLMLFNVENTSLDFHYECLYRFNGRINNVLACNYKNILVVSTYNPSALFFSKNDQHVSLERGEIVTSLTEWNAKFKGKVNTYILVSTKRPSAKSRFLLYGIYKPEINNVFEKLFTDDITCVLSISKTLAVFSHNNKVFGISLETGSLTRKFTYEPEKITSIIDLSYESNCLAILSEKNGFSLIDISKENSPVHLFHVKKHIIGKNIKVYQNHIIITDLIGNVLFYDIKGDYIKQINLITTCTNIIASKNKLLACCITGHMYILSFNEEESTKNDLSTSFTFNTPRLMFND